MLLPVHLSEDDSARRRDPNGDAGEGSFPGASPAHRHGHAARPRGAAAPVPGGAVLRQSQGGGGGVAAGGGGLDQGVA